MILVVDDNCDVQKKIRCIFYKMGFHSIGSKYCEVRSRLASGLPIAVLIVNSDYMNNVHLFADELKSDFPKVPLLVLRNKRTSCTNYFLMRKYFDRVFDESVYSTTVLSAVIELQKEYTGIDYSNIIAGGVNIKIDFKSIMFFGAR